LHNADLKRINTKDEEAIKPAGNDSAQVAGTAFSATLKPQSWNVFVLKSAG